MPEDSVNQSKPDGRYPLGVIHGRFQILHNDHRRYLLAGKNLCDHLVVGITNPDPSLTRTDASDQKRSRNLANPLTYYERHCMVKEVLLEAGIAYEKFSIVPLPINLPELYKYYVPLEAVFFLSIYDEWGRRKQEMFRDLDLKTHVLWDVPEDKKGLSSSDIRQQLILGKDFWRDQVPTATERLVEDWEIAKRLREITANP